jgi:type IV pilus assembly protein PilX
MTCHVAILTAFESPRLEGRGFLDTDQGSLKLHKRLSHLPRYSLRGLRSTRVRPQRGATLIIVLVLLLVMSLLAATSLRGTLMQERMSSNAYDRDLAFQSAEAGLRMGEHQVENWVKNGADMASLSDCKIRNTETGLYLNTNPAECPQPLWEVSEPGTSGSYWHDASGDAGDDVTIGFSNDKLSLAPYYIVELIATNAPCQLNEPGTNTSCRRFRVTASSRAAGGRARVVLQSIYATD